MKDLAHQGMVQCIQADIDIPVSLNLMIRHMVLHTVTFINAYPDEQGVYTKYLPSEIILKWQLDFVKHCHAQFGSYCLTYKEPNKTNTIEGCTQQAICLGPTGNFQRNHKFMYLERAQVIKQL